MRSTVAMLLALCVPLAAQISPAAPKTAAPKQSVSKPSAAKPSAFDKVTLEQYVRHLMLLPPQVTIEVGDPKPSGVAGLKEVKIIGSMGARSQTLTFFVSDDGKKIIQGSVYDVSQNPFKTNIDKLNTAFQPALGTAGAPVVLVVFSDFQCPHCKDEAKMLRANLIKNYPKEVRLYFKDFPIEQAHPWAKTASMAGRCVYRQNMDAFWDFHDWAFDNQETLTLDNFGGKLTEFATSKKLDSLALKACLESKVTAEIVEKNQAEGKDIGISSTPTIVLNGRPLPGSIPWDKLQELIQFELDYQKVAKNAGDDCGCEVKLPSLLGK